MIIKCRAIVLRTIDYAESSRIATLLTDSHGKITVMVKGARGPKSASGKLIQPMAELEVVFYFKEGRDIQNLSQAASTVKRNLLLADYDRMMNGFKVLEWLNRLQLPADDSPAVFLLTSRVLSLLDSTSELNRLWYSKFLLRLSQIHGYEPNAWECSSCGQLFNQMDVSLQGKFRLASGEFFCPECSGNQSAESGVSMAVVQQMAAWLYPNRSQQVSLQPDDIDQMEMILEKHLRYHTDS